MFYTEPRPCEFPEVIDATMLSTWRSCNYKMFRMYMEHWKPQGTGVHLHAGAAFAHGVEEVRRAFWEEGADPELAVGRGVLKLLEFYGDFQCPEGESKSKDRMAGALEFYFSDEGWPLETEYAVPKLMPSGKRAIEFSFAEPLPVMHPVTGNPLIYAGRTDQLVEYAGGDYLEDDKTTKSLGANWVQQWDLRSQFSGYSWAARQIGIDIKGVLVRGVSILKTKYDRAECPTYRSQFEIDRWLDKTCHDLERMKDSWDKGIWDMDLDHACTEFGGCVLRQPCKSPEPLPWLRMYFQKIKWNPLTRTEVLVPESVGS